MFGNEASGKRRRAAHRRTSLLIAVLMGFSLLVPVWTAVAAPASGSRVMPQSLEQRPGLIAFLRQGNLWSMNGDGTDQRQIIDVADPIRDFSWSPSGRYLLVQHGGRSVVQGQVVQSDVVTELYDVVTGELREIERAPRLNWMIASANLPVWATDADEIVQVDFDTENGRTYSLTRLGLDGTATRLASFDEPNLCGGPDGPMATMWQLAMEQTGGGWHRNTYEPLIWSSRNQVAWVRPICGQSRTIDLATGEVAFFAHEPFAALGSYLLIRDRGGSWSTLTLFDPATGGLTPLFEGDEFAAGPNGAIYFMRTVRGEESGFHSRFDDVPTGNTNNTIELWQTDVDASEPVHIASIPAFGAGMPRITADGSAVVVGTVDNPAEFFAVDEWSAEQFTPDLYAEHLKAMRVDLASGAVRLLADDVILPKPQPGHLVDTENAGPPSGPVPSTSAPDPTATLVAAQPIATATLVTARPIATATGQPGNSSDSPPGAEFGSVAPIFAITCTTSAEGFWISGGGGVHMPEGCDWSNGAVFRISGSTGESYGTCTISGFSCQGEVRIPADVDVIVTLDETTIPEGYAVVDGNPKQFTLPAIKIQSDSEQWLFASVPVEQPGAGQETAGEPNSRGEDGWIAYTGGDGNVWLVQPDGSRPTQVTFDGAPGDPYVSPSWAHDGSKLIFTRPISESREASRVYLLVDGVVSTIPGVYGCSLAAFMPGDAQIALACNWQGEGDVPAGLLQTDPSRGLISIANLDGGNWSVRLAYRPVSDSTGVHYGTGVGGMFPTSLSVARDGTIFFGAAMSLSSYLNWVEPGSTEIHRMVAPSTGSIDGRFIDSANAVLARICAGCYVQSREQPQASFVWMDRGGSAIETLLALDPELMAGVPAISPDGRTLVYTVRDRTSSYGGELHTRDLVTGQDMTIGMGGNPAWQPAPGGEPRQPTAPGPMEPAGASLPERWVGTSWAGIGDQDEPVMSWPVAIAFTNGRVGEVVGTVDYPTLGCGGEIVLVSVSGDEWASFEARERLTYGQDTCIDGGVAVFTSAEGAFRLVFRWQSPSGPTTALATLDPAA